MITPTEIRQAASRSYNNPDKTDAMLRQALCDAADELERLREERPSLVMDKARLDFLQSNACEEGRTMAMPRYAYRVKQWQGDPGPNIRSAIDIEMREHANAAAESTAPNFP